ncbi:MAG: MATE family efflux transporter [Clostridium sp.]
MNKQEAKEVLQIAIPAVGEMILCMMTGVLDTLMIGRYGGQFAVSTVGISWEILNMFANVLIIMGVCVAITSIVSRLYGAKRTDTAEEYASIGFAIGIVIVFLTIFIIFTFADTFLKLAGCEPNVLLTSKRFIRIVCIGMFFNMITNMFSAIQRAYGNTKIPLIGSMILIGVNLTLDYSLIFGNFGFPELGIDGAAIATVTAQICSFSFALYYILTKSKIKIRLHYLKNITFHKLKDIFKVSIPASLQEGAFSVSRMLTSFMIMHLGTVAFSANTITGSLESLSYMPGWGFAVACTAMVGNKIGEEDYDSAKKYAYNCAILGLGSMLLISSSFVLIPELLIKLFIGSTEIDVITLGSKCLMIAALQQPTMAISMIYGGALKGIGDTTTPFKVSLFTGWCIRLPLVYYFIYLKRYSVTYFWWICVIQWLLDGILIYISYKKKFSSFPHTNKKVELNEV